MRRAALVASNAGSRFASSLREEVRRARGLSLALLGVLVPNLLYAADPAEPASKSSPQHVGAALAALLAICILGAAFVGFIWLTGRQVRRITRKPTTKTEYDPLWFLKPRSRRLEDAGETNSSRGEDLS